MKHSLAHSPSWRPLHISMLPPLLLALLLSLPQAGLAQGSAVNGRFAGIPVTRLWLPESKEYLRPYLEMAVLRAQQNTECAEVMYASLNDYRTAREEPTFTILCRRDLRSTFNLVYMVSELDPNFVVIAAPGTGDDGEDSAASSALDLLRERLGEEELLPTAPPPVQATSPAPPQQTPPSSSDSQSLDLDLNEMLRVPANRREPAPDLF